MTDVKIDGCVDKSRNMVVYLLSKGWMDSLTPSLAKTRSRCFKQGRGGFGNLSNTPPNLPLQREGFAHPSQNGFMTAFKRNGNVG
jgi:hypothetical protein